MTRKDVNKHKEMSLSDLSPDKRLEAEEVEQGHNHPFAAQRRKIFFALSSTGKGSFCHT